MALKNFDQIVERAKQSFTKKRVVIAGADSENILLGAFEAQDAGFSTPILVGDAGKIEPMLERLGLKNKPYRLVATPLFVGNQPHLTLPDKEYRGAAAWRSASFQSSGVPLQGRVAHFSRVEHLRRETIRCSRPDEEI